VIFALEWRIALRARRLFLLNAGIPLLLVAPLALGGAPDVHAAVVYTVLFAFFGTFGSAIPLVRDVDSGLFGRIVRTGLPTRRVLAERLAAHTLLDVLQLLPGLVLILAAAGTGAGAALRTLLAALAVLLAANTLGIWVASAGRSIAEAALFATILSLFGLHLGGVFRAPAGGVLAGIAHVLPFGHLHAAMREALGIGGAEASIGVALAGALVASGATVALAEPLVRRLTRHTAR
jgi:hypothetical protein